MIRLLQGEERELLRTIYAEEFASELPPIGQANIVASLENNKIQGFITSEVLIRVGMLAVTPKLRKTPHSARIVKELVRYLYQNVPPGASVITIASDSRYASIFKKLGMREEQGKVFRLDF